MLDTIVEYVNFVGSGLYLLTAIIFLFLFIRTLGTKDGIGLLFLRVLTSSITIGSGVVFTIRVLSEYGPLPLLTARAIAIINPISLLMLALYLNYLFNHPVKPLILKDSKNIKIIKDDVKEVKADMKQVKKKIVKNKIN